MGQCSITRRGLDTSDATATAADILTGKTAYVDGVKLIGTSAAKELVIKEISNSGFTTSLSVPEIVGKENVVICNEVNSSEYYQINQILCGCYLKDIINTGIIIELLSSTSAYVTKKTLIPDFVNGTIKAESNMVFWGKYRVLIW